MQSTTQSHTNCNKTAHWESIQWHTDPTKTVGNCIAHYDIHNNPIEIVTKKLNENQYNDTKIQPKQLVTALPIMQSTTQSNTNCNKKLNEIQYHDTQIQPKQLVTAWPTMQSTTQSNTNWNKKLNENQYNDTKIQPKTIGNCIAHNATHNTIQYKLCQKTSMRINTMTHRSNQINW